MNGLNVSMISRWKREYKSKIVDRNNSLIPDAQNLIKFEVIGNNVEIIEQ